MQIYTTNLYYKFILQIYTANLYYKFMLPSQMKIGPLAPSPLLIVKLGTSKTKKDKNITLFLASRI